MYPKTTLAVLWCLLIALAASAQYQAPPVWTFGHHAGLDFTGGTPVPITTSIETHAAVSATQCDAQGNILFYANGFRIWDAQGNAMPGSINPLWPTSYTSGWNMNAMIIPDAMNPDRYYVFQTFPSKGVPPWGPYYVGQLTYSVVDMTLNGGLGDVVSGQNHVQLDINTGHYMTIVPGDNCNYWVVVQNGNPGVYQFKTYEVNGNGVNHTPVTSTFGFIPSLFPNGTGKDVGVRSGNMIYSHTRKKLIVAYENADICAFDINTASGIVSNASALTWAYPAIEFVSSATEPAICLSPDESLLYVSGSATSTQGFKLYQFPLITNGSSLTVGPRTVIFSTQSATYLSIQQSTGFAWQQSAMQLGPDNKIYHAFTMGQNFLGRINQPNLPGLACDFVPIAMQLQPGTYTTSSMPAPMFVRRSAQPVAGTKKDTMVCFQPYVQLRAPDGFSVYTWQNGQPGQTFNAASSGLYTVKSSNSDCTFRTDSFEVKLINFQLSLGEDIKTCSTIILNPATDVPQPANYTWQDGTVQPTLEALTPGVYWVSVSTPEGCSLSDTVVLSEESLPLSLPADTLICKGTPLRLDATIPGASYVWQDGSTAPYFDAGKKGVYSVLVTKGYCSAGATTLLDEVYCGSCINGVPDAFTPNKDGLNDVFRPLLHPDCSVSNYRLSVYNRYGQMVFYSRNPGSGWDGTFNGKPADIGSYMYYLEFKGLLEKKYFHKGDVTLIR